MKYILKANQLIKAYDRNSDHQVVKSITLSVKEGDIHVIQGKSGSGKSTLLSMLGGMETPTSGKVYYKDASFYDLTEEQQANIRGEAFGFVFQSLNLIPEFTVLENIELPLQFINNKNKKWDTEELARILEIEKHLQKKPYALSGGEQQRVALARALITSPKILFADEPTGNLDPSTTKVIIELLTGLNQSQGLTLIVVTHEKELFQHPHRLYVMHNGRLKES